MYTRTKTVLIVEPDTPARTGLRVALSPYDYRVFDARDGQEALAVVSTLGGRLDLLICELALPDVDGLELARRVVARRPAVKILIISARCEDVLFLHPEMSGRAQFLAKPFKPNIVLRAIRQLLGTDGNVEVRVHAQQVRLTRPRPAEPGEFIVRLALKVARLRQRAQGLHLETERGIHQYALIRRQSELLWREICSAGGQQCLRRLVEGEQVHPLRAPAVAF